MKKISSVFKNNHEFILRPFALHGHTHDDYMSLSTLSVPELADRDAIDVSLRFEGFLCYVIATQTTYRLELGITNSSWVAFGTSGGSVTYTNATAMPADFGGLPSGRTFSNETIQDILDDMLYPYVAVNATSLSADIGNSLREKGDTVTSTINFTANYTLGSADLVSIVFKRGGTQQQTGLTNTFAEVDDITDTVSFTAEVYDGTTTDIASRNYSFVYPFYYGVDASSASAADAAAKVVLLTKAIENSGDKTKGFAPSNQVYYFAYPASYGTLTRVLDWNSFDITADFTVHTQNITGLDANPVSYYIYEFNNLVTHSSQNLVFDT